MNMRCVLFSSLMWLTALGCGNSSPPSNDHYPIYEDRHIFPSEEQASDFVAEEEVYSKDSRVEYL